MFSLFHPDFEHICCRYDGATPYVFITDRDMIKEICQKKFDSFLDRIEFPVEDKYRTLDVLMGEPWKWLRKSLSPMFTSGKIKSMIEPIDKVIEKLTNHLDNRAASSTDPGERVKFWGWENVSHFPQKFWGKTKFLICSK